MKSVGTAQEPLERAIARLLLVGTWLATGITATGMLLDAYGRRNLDLARIGIAFFIVLPVARVCLTIVVFIRQRDYLYASIATLVLAIVAAGFLAATLTHGVVTP